MVARTDFWLRFNDDSSSIPDRYLGGNFKHAPALLVAGRLKTLAGLRWEPISEPRELLPVNLRRLAARIARVALLEDRPHPS